MEEENHHLSRQDGHLQKAIREHPEHHWIYARCRLEVGRRLSPGQAGGRQDLWTPFWTSWIRVFSMMLGYNFPPTLTSTLVCNGSLVSLCWSTARLMMMQCGDYQSMMSPSPRLFKAGICWEVQIWRRSRSSWWPYVHPTWRRRRCRRPCSWSLVRTTSLPWTEMTRNGIVEVTALAGAMQLSMRMTMMTGKRSKAKTQIGAMVGKTTSRLVTMSRSMPWSSMRTRCTTRRRRLMGRRTMTWRPMTRHMQPIKMLASASRIWSWHVDTCRLWHLLILLREMCLLGWVKLLIAPAAVEVSRVVERKEKGVDEKEKEKAKPRFAIPQHHRSKLIPVDVLQQPSVFVVAKLDTPLLLVRFRRSKESRDHPLRNQWRRLMRPWWSLSTSSARREWTARWWTLVLRRFYVAMDPSSATSSTWSSLDFLSTFWNFIGSVASSISEVMVKVGAIGLWGSRCFWRASSARFKSFSWREKPLCYVDGRSSRLLALTSVLQRSATGLMKDTGKMHYLACMENTCCRSRMTMMLGSCSHHRVLTYVSTPRMRRRTLRLASTSLTPRRTSSLKQRPQSRRLFILEVNALNNDHLDPTFSTPRSWCSVDWSRTSRPMSLAIFMNASRRFSGKSTLARRELLSLRKHKEWKSRCLARKLVGTSTRLRIEQEIGARVPGWGFLRAHMWSMVYHAELECPDRRAAWGSYRAPRLAPSGTSLLCAKGLPHANQTRRTCSHWTTRLCVVLENQCIPEPARTEGDLWSVSLWMCVSRWRRDRVAGEEANNVPYQQEADVWHHESSLWWKPWPLSLGRLRTWSWTSHPLLGGLPARLRCRHCQRHRCGWTPLSMGVCWSCQWGEVG